MEDQRIVDLFWERSEIAIELTQKKYGKYCHSIAYNILKHHSEAEECVNDTYMGAWNAIPPHKPERLSTFLGKITRNLALNRYIRNHARKRAPQTALVLEEVAEFVPCPESSAGIADEVHLRQVINAFLGSLPEQTRMIFVRRYWYLSAVKEIARDFGLSESNVKVTLMRTRNCFKVYLEAAGIEV